MLINKITTGFVIQTYDTDKGEYISQEFKAGDQVDYEGNNGESLSINALSNLGFGPFADSGEPYLPFDMVQPCKEGDISHTD